MTYNFDKTIRRTKTTSSKWDNVEQVFGRKDILPMWVADMDFTSPPEVLGALKKRVQHGVFGYTFADDVYYSAIEGWLNRRHNWEVKRESILFSPGVVTSLAVAVNAYTEPGDEVLIQTPVYFPFFSVIEKNHRVIVENPLKQVDGKYEMDFDHLEGQLRRGIKMMILCSPHNPIGRVWTKEELRRLGELCAKYKTVIVSDEIHADLVYPGQVHTPMASISEELAQITVTCNAPTKTFNLAGLHVSTTIIQNEDLRSKFKVELDRMSLGTMHVLSTVALISAYTHGEPWLDELMRYLAGNRDYLLARLAADLPQVTAVRPEGTYLMWLNFNELGMSPEDLQHFFVHKAKVGLNQGTTFGTNGAGYMRMNIGCPRVTLEKGLGRIINAVKRHI